MALRHGITRRRPRALPQLLEPLPLLLRLGSPHRGGSPVTDLGDPPRTVENGPGEVTPPRAGPARRTARPCRRYRKSAWPRGDGVAARPRRLSSQHDPGTEKTKGPTPRSQSLPDLHVHQIDGAVAGDPLHVEAELPHKALTCGYAGASQHRPSTGSREKVQEGPRGANATQHDPQFPKSAEPLTRHIRLVPPLCSPPGSTAPRSLRHLDVLPDRSDRCAPESAAS